METSFWKKLVTQNGFTLPELMIGGAIIAGVALAGATLFKDQSRAQSRVEHDQILAQFHASMAKTLENSVNCNATLSSYFGASSVGASDLIPDIRVCSSSVGSASKCAEGSGPGEVMNAAIVASEGKFIDQEGDGSFYTRVCNLVTNSCSLNLASPSTPSSVNTGRQIWTITSIAPGAAATKTGPFILNLTYTLNPRIGVRTIRKQISLNVRFSNNVFQECYNNQKSSITTLQSDLCKSLSSLSSTGVTSDGQVATFNDLTQQCELNTNLKDCTAQGMMVEGVRSDGTVHCRAISEGFDPTPSINGSSTSCSSSSSTAKLQFVGGQLQVVCTP